MDGPREGQPGGIAGLRRLLEEHGEAIEADLERFYGIRLSKALFSPRPEDRYSARELLVRIRGLAHIPEALYRRTHLGPMADWDLQALLLRLIEFNSRARLWQESGGKGGKPKPLELPEDKTRTGRPSGSNSNPDVIDRLRNLGMIPAGASD